MSLLCRPIHAPSQISRLVLAGAVLLLPGTPPPPQTPTPPAAQTPADANPDGPITTLKVATRIVSISAVVTSKSGDPTGGLTKDDFILKQDGREEPVRYFSQGADLPLTLALLVDTSGSQRTLINDEVLAADVFFETMLTQPQDRAALIQFDARVLQIRALTASPDQLHLSLLSLRSDPQFAGATLLNDAVDAVARKILANQTGRKAMILLTDGGDAGSHTPIARAIEQAQRNDIPIYSILYTAADEAAPLSRAGNAVAGSLARGGASDPGPAILENLSSSTGGHVFTVSPNQSLRSIFARIAADLRLQYELGYTPPPNTPPNTYHRLELRTRDRQLTTQARKGFFTPP